MKYSNTIETSNLVFKKGDLKYAKQMHENFFSQPQTAKYMLWSVTNTVEEAEAKIARWMEHQKDHAHWFIHLKTTDEPIGFITAEEIEPNVYGNIGLCLGEGYINQGYGTEALVALIEYLKSLGAKTISYSHLKDNVASQKLALKLGFKFNRQEKRLRKHDGKEFDEIFYTLEL